MVPVTKLRICGTCLAAGTWDEPWECPGCEEVSHQYNKMTGEGADADYALHELAHHVVLFRALPRYRKDWRRIEHVIFGRPTGRAQDHEMRVLALQAVAYEKLGWNSSVERFVEMSWPGILEAADSSFAYVSYKWRKGRGGRKIVSTSKQAVEGVRARMPKVSRRNVRMYINAVRSMKEKARTR
jgi:hypothetical protein